MSKRAEIKNYADRKEVEADYERFKDEWRYDAETESGQHQSGLIMRLAYYDSPGVEYENLPEWAEKLHQDGLLRDEIEDYMTMLQVQFQIMNEKNPYQEHESTKEELEDFQKRHIELMTREFRADGATEEEIAQEVAEFNAFFEKRFFGR